MDLKVIHVCGEKCEIICIHAIVSSILFLVIESLPSFKQKHVDVDEEYDDAVRNADNMVKHVIGINKESLVNDNVVTSDNNVANVNDSSVTADGGFEVKTGSQTLNDSSHIENRQENGDIEKELKEDHIKNNLLLALCLDPVPKTNICTMHSGNRDISVLENQKETVHFISPVAVVYEYSQTTCSPALSDISTQILSDSESEDFLMSQNKYIREVEKQNEGSDVKNNDSTPELDTPLCFGKGGCMDVGIMTAGGDCFNVAVTENAESDGVLLEQFMEREKCTAIEPSKLDNDGPDDYANENYKTQGNVNPTGDFSNVTLIAEKQETEEGIASVKIDNYNRQSTYIPNVDSVTLADDAECNVKTDKPNNKDRTKDLSNKIDEQHIDEQQIDECENDIKQHAVTSATELNSSARDITEYDYKSSEELETIPKVLPTTLACGNECATMTCDRACLSDMLTETCKMNCTSSEDLVEKKNDSSLQAAVGIEAECIRNCSIQNNVVNEIFTKISLATEDNETDMIHSSQDLFIDSDQRNVNQEGWLDEGDSKLFKTSEKFELEGTFCNNKQIQDDMIAVNKKGDICDSMQDSLDSDSVKCCLGSEDDLFVSNSQIRGNNETTSNILEQESKTNCKYYSDECENSKDNCNVTDGKEDNNLENLNYAVNKQVNVNNTHSMLQNTPTSQTGKREQSSPVLYCSPTLKKHKSDAEQLPVVQVKKRKLFKVEQDGNGDVKVRKLDCDMLNLTDNAKLPNTLKELATEKLTTLDETVIWCSIQKSKTKAKNMETIVGKGHEKDVTVVHCCESLENRNCKTVENNNIGSKIAHHNVSNGKSINMLDKISELTCIENSEEVHAVPTCSIESDENAVMADVEEHCEPKSDEIKHVANDASSEHENVTESMQASEYIVRSPVFITATELLSQSSQHSGSTGFVFNAIGKLENDLSSQSSSVIYSVGGISEEHSDDMNQSVEVIEVESSVVANYGDDLSVLDSIEKTKEQKLEYLLGSIKDDQAIDETETIHSVETNEDSLSKSSVCEIPNIVEVSQDSISNDPVRIPIRQHGKNVIEHTCQQRIIVEITADGIEEERMEEAVPELLNNLERHGEIADCYNGNVTATDQDEQIDTGKVRFPLLIYNSLLENHCIVILR